MADTVKVSWSGGKDSTCAVLQHIKRGHHVKVVCYIPMFTKTIPLLTKKHYDFIQSTAEYFESLGAEVYIVTGKTYTQYVKHRSTRGKYKGRVFGFPSLRPGQCGFKRDSKVKALNSVDVGDYDYQDIGVAVDEVKRHSQLSEKKRSILVELGITEAEAYAICKKKGLLSPQYAVSRRDGCVLCPFGKKAERDEWLRDYPQARAKLLKLQDFVKENRPGTAPLYGYKWFIDE